MVKHIEIGGASRPVLYNINALIEFEELTGHEILQNSLQMDLRSLKKLRALAYVGLKYGARREGLKEVITLDEVGEWLSISDNSIPQIVEAFRSSSEGEPNSGVKTESEEIKN